LLSAPYYLMVGIAGYWWVVVIVAAAAAVENGEQ
jgi:hypothetical protein